MRLVGCFDGFSSAVSVCYRAGWMFSCSQLTIPPLLEGRSCCGASCSQNTAFAHVVIYKPLRSKILDHTELEPGRGGSLQSKEPPLWRPILSPCSPSCSLAALLERQTQLLLSQQPSPLSADEMASRASPRGVCAILGKGLLEIPLALLSPAANWDY